MTSSEIRNKIKKVVDDKKKEDQIISLFWDLDAFNSFLTKNDALEALVEFLPANPEFTRHQFYSHYVSNKNQSNGEILKLLRQVAVAMELIQKNELDTRELVQVLNELGTADEAAINEVSSNQFVQISKERKFSFTHHTIQEFLAAQYIEEQENPVETFEKLALLQTEDIKAIKPSWLNVVRFMLEGKHAGKILDTILEVTADDLTNVNDLFADALSSFDPKRLTEVQQKDLFYTIYDAYIEKAIWLPTWASKNIWQIAPKEAVKTIEDLFKREIVTIKQAVNVGNAIPIISGIIENKPNYIQDGAFWKNKFIEFTKESKGYGVVQRRALEALEYFKGDEDILGQIEGVMDTSKDKLVRDALIETAYTILPNFKTTIDLIVKGYQKGNSISARYGIYAITEKETFDYFIEKLLESEGFRDKFLEDSFLFSSEKDNEELNLAKKIRKFATDERTLGLLKQLFEIACQYEHRHNYNRRSVFLPEVAKVISEKDSEYIFVLIEKIKTESKDDPFRVLWEFERFLPYFFTSNNAVRLATAIMEANPERTYFVQSIIHGLKNENVKGGNEIFKILVDKKFVKFEDKEQKAHDKQDDDNTYQEFRKRLEPEEGKFSPDVFQAYLNNKEQLEAIIQPEELERLKDLIINTVLEKWDPRNIELKIKGKNELGGTGQYSITSFAPVYGDAMRVAEVLLPKEKLAKYRENLLLFLPFAYHDERQAIINILGNVSDEELGDLNSVFLDKTSDSRYFMPSSYIHFIKSLQERGNKLNSAKEVLLSFIHDEKIENYAKLEAIEVLGAFIGLGSNDDQEELRKIFNEFHEDENDYKRKTGEYANKLLIQKFQDLEAINWRFEQIIKRAEPFTVPEGMHKVSTIEEEVHSLEFAFPLMELDKKFIPNFLELLDKSFEILEHVEIDKPDKFKNYTNYIWRIVTGYFENLSKQRDIQPYIKLLNHYQEKTYKNNWFEFKLDDLRNVYVGVVGAPSVSDIKGKIDGTR